MGPKDKISCSKIERLFQIKCTPIYLHLHAYACSEQSNESCGILPATINIGQAFVLNFRLAGLTRSCINYDYITSHLYVLLTCLYIDKLH